MTWRLPAAVLAWGRHRATVAAAASLAATMRPNQPVLIDDAGALTGTQLMAAAERLATDWTAADLVRPGQRLGLLAGNNRDFVIALVAASLIGADLVLLSTFAPPSSLAEVLTDQQINLVGADARNRTLAQDALTTAFEDPAKRLIMLSEEAPPRRGHPPESRGPESRGPEFSGTGAGAPTNRLRLPRPRSPGRLILLSSGTGGRLKALARESYGGPQLLPSAYLIRQLRLRNGEPMLVAPPLFHGFGLGFLIVGLLCGVPVVLADRPDPGKINTLITRHRVRTLVAVPPTLVRLTELSALDRPMGDRPLRAIVTGSSRLDPTCSDAVMKTFGPILFNLYGCTEAGWATLARPRDLLRAPGTIGRAVPGVRVKVINDELHVSSPFRTGGSGNTMRPTGDLGHRDDHGLLFLDGRNDDLCVIGGENVNLSQIEERLTSHRQIIEAAVDALPDPAYGSRLRARIVTRGSAGPSSAELHTFLAVQLPPQAIPREFERVTTIDRGPSGKAIKPGRPDRHTHETG